MTPIGRVIWTLAALRRGYVFLLHGGAISWQSRLQPTVATSTVEAEYMAVAAAVKEALWLRTLLADLGFDARTVRIACDNRGTVQRLLSDNVVSQRTKHIDVQYHFARERALRGEVAFRDIASKDNVADCLTKPLASGCFLSAAMICVWRGHRVFMAAGNAA